MSRTYFRRSSGRARTVRGDLISQAQESLKQSGHYRYTVDGVFGEKTENVLIAFQLEKGLAPTGQLDEETWRAAVSQTPPDIEGRCLQLTADFEGTGFTKAVGNFDGAGVTWGIIGFTLSNGELQRVLNDIRSRHAELFRESFGALAGEMNEILDASIGRQMQWAREISVGRSKYKILREWAEAFERLGSRGEVKAVQLEHTEKYWRIARSDFAEFGLQSELGLALCFDTAVQNGGIDPAEARRIHMLVEGSPPRNEEELRVIIAGVIAASSRPRYAEDVRSRKLTLATSRGEVHLSAYDLKTWGLDDEKAT